MDLFVHKWKTSQTSMSRCTGLNAILINVRAFVQVVILQNDVSDPFSKALEGNLKYALHTALLLSPEKITLEDFFMILSGCSYEGERKWHE